jgi:hypothetical protein
VIQFEQTQLPAIRSLLGVEKANGNLWVTCPVQNNPLGKDDLNFFNSPYDALEHCYEQSTDWDKWEIKTVDELQTITVKNSKIMKQENLDYLQRQVKFTGFGESLDNQLKEKMEQGQPEFQLTHKQKFGKDETEATLNFRRSDQTDNYYFNSYDMAVKNSNAQTPVEQKFYIGKNNNFTFKEAYNLLCGRAVNKDLINREGDKYNSWVKLDFKETEQSGNYKMKHYTEAYGYKLDEALAKHPIKELTNEEDKEKLTDSLYRGNRQQVTFLRENGEQKGYIEANPQFKSVIIYDNNLKRVSKSETQSQSNEQSKAKTAKLMPAHDSEGGSKKKTRNQRKGTGVS